MGVLRHHVAGQEFGSTERTGPVHNPATGAAVGEVAYASTADANAVIAGLPDPPPQKRQEIRQAGDHVVGLAASA